MLKKIEIIAPSHWASFLINGDSSGLDILEYQQAAAFIERQGVGMPVSCEEAGFCRSHDALPEMPLAADCQTYTFLVEEKPLLPYMVRRKYFSDTRTWETFVLFPTIAALSSEYYSMEATAENGGSFACSPQYYFASQAADENTEFVKGVVKLWETDKDFPCALKLYRRMHSSFLETRKEAWRKSRESKA